MSGLENLIGIAQGAASAMAVAGRIAE